MAGRSPTQQASCSQQDEMDDCQFTDSAAVADYLPLHHAPHPRRPDGASHWRPFYRAGIAADQCGPSFPEISDSLTD
jgi:hypothetical protein